MKTIGKYQVADEIGRSAAGVAFRARDPFRNREFALKVLSPLAALTAAAKERLYRDLATSWELVHRHIAKVHDVGELDGGVYIATEMLVGSGLAGFLSMQTVSISEKLALIAQVCEALAFAHSAGIAHGNIKPGNVFITDARNAAILDFGTGTWQTLLLASGVRLNGLLVNYLAPEQILGQPFDGRSDIFSVGVALYEMLSGKYPFEAAPGLIPREIVHAEPEPLRKWNAQLPEDLEEIVVRALKKNPADRFQTADELAANLYVIAQRLRREPAAPPADLSLTARSDAEIDSRSHAVVQPVAQVDDKLDTTPEPATPITGGGVPEVAPPEAAPPPEPVPMPEAPTVDAVPEPVAFSQPSVVAVPPVVPAAAPAVPLAAPPLATATAPPVTAPPVTAMPQVWQPPPIKHQAKPRRRTRRLVTFATGAVMALSMVAVIVVRQNQGAQSNHQAVSPAAAAASQRREGPGAVPSAVEQKEQPAPVETAPVTTPQPAAVNQPAQPDPEQILRDVRPLWEAGQYAQAMRLVDEVLARSPANAEARVWKKRIRAAQEAEAAVK